ncbi:peptidyl-alpha-hydroxyglycine alpha-amidating lyase family protein [Qipengyuania sp. XHP0207]|uniref:peptidyl-alpha-hydroxyglycine alpha-amidating lyase family protein n=1 Tax=Qipengyuania sp. XHP0207 TaxID=3038078 RepID=UPI00241D50DE|nr:peptidyl-alpha-hydroxyglycine alpha-amidating lyase family protein [Qipengyuania sp. XHP0207]MDG5747118.1 peptidyl-alpha-hydroxyglycine alpha-amidating lyase family protein [Qipengyuania sp. XHP0207]
MLGAVLLAACGGAAREEVPRAAIDSDWPSIPDDAVFGQVSAVAADSHGHIFVLHRAGRPWEEPFPSDPIAEPTVFMFAPGGALLAKWGAGDFIMPHGLSVDAGDNIWITDVAREQVLRFSHDGDEQLVLGERGVTAQDEGHFGRPADTAFIGNRALVADGYVNTRIAEFDRSGAFLRDWGDFSIAHAIAVDEERIYVADRENARIQIFDHAGELLESRATPTGGHPYGLATLGGGWLVSVEGRDRADRFGAIVRVYTPEGAVERSLDVSSEDAEVSLGHDIAIGRDGMAYVADVHGDRVVRFELSPAQEPSE